MWLFSVNIMLTKLQGKKGSFYSGHLNFRGIISSLVKRVGEILLGWVFD